MENELLQARSAVNCRGVAEMVRDMAARELGLRRAGYAMVAREITAELAKGCGVEDLKPHCAMIVTAYRSCTNPREMMESYYKTLCGILCHAVHSGPAKGETVNVSQLGSADACVIGEFARGLGFRVAELDTDGVEGDEEQFSFPPVKSGES
mmetsp:Transcript_9943/g.30323  ORF Transcript_9943/g.30323 Transcript_9943/m.30323 type:complete len:152 (+) Transcript_9943:725-1180(+)